MTDRTIPAQPDEVEERGHCGQDGGTAHHPQRADCPVYQWSHARRGGACRLNGVQKALIERPLGAELSRHLGDARGADQPRDGKNPRNRASAKTVLTEDGPLRTEVPRDRTSSFESLRITKHECGFTGFDDKIVAMYARGMTVREIQGFLADLHSTQCRS